MISIDNSKFLVVKGRAGLGNRILSALTGILYARLTGRLLFVDWSDRMYSDDKSNVFHRFFVCSSVSPRKEIPKTDSIYPRAWLGHLHRSVGNLERHYENSGTPDSTGPLSIDVTNLDYQENGVVFWSYTHKLDGLAKHFGESVEERFGTHPEDIGRKLLRDDLLLHPKVRKQVERFKSNHFEKKTIGVHVRYSDRQTDLGAILRQLDVLLKRQPGLQIFLSTDNVQVKESLEGAYPRLVTTSHCYPPPGLRAHGRRDNSSRMQHGIEALIDLYLLAECQYLIVDTRSSFSYVASWLAKTSSSKIFDLRQGERRSRPLGQLMWGLWLKHGTLRRVSSVLRHGAGL